MPFRPFLKDRTTTGGLARLQDTAESSVRGTVSGTPADGILLEDIALTTSAVDHAHKLGRRWQGAFLVKSSATGVYVTPTESSDDSKYVGLSANTTATCSIWVF